MDHMSWRKITLQTQNTKQNSVEHISQKEAAVLGKDVTLFIALKLKKWNYKKNRLLCKITDRYFMKEEMLLKL